MSENNNTKKPSRNAARRTLHLERRQLAKKAVIEAVGEVWGAENVPDGYTIDDIFATDYHVQDWGWWFYLTAKGSKTIIFKVSYNYARETYQVAFYSREYVTEFPNTRITEQPNPFEQEQ